VPEENKPVIDVGDMGLVHIQRQFQAAFQKGPSFITDGLGMCFGALDDNDEVVGVTAVGDSRFPLPVLTNRNGATLLDAEVPCPAILSCLVTQVFRLQPRIKLMEHDIGQERRQDAALRNTFAGSHEQATVNVACLQEPPEQINKPVVPDTPPDATKQKPVVNRVEVARQITFDDPAAPRPGATILQLYLYGPDSVMHAAFRPEAVGEAMEVAFPDRLHGHQHRTLDDAVFQGRDTQWAFLAIGFRDIDSLDRLRCVISRQQIRVQAGQVFCQSSLHPLLVHSVDARCMGAA